MDKIIKIILYCIRIKKFDKDNSNKNLKIEKIIESKRENKKNAEEKLTKYKF